MWQTAFYNNFRMFFLQLLLVPVTSFHGSYSMLHVHPQHLFSRIRFRIPRIRQADKGPRSLHGWHPRIGPLA